MFFLLKLSVNTEGEVAKHSSKITCFSVVSDVVPLADLMEDPPVLQFHPPLEITKIITASLSFSVKIKHFVID